VTCVKDYSYLKATMGSTRMARRAGMQPAKSATAASNAPAATHVIGSVGLVS
jgi:hypothetical protein